MSISSWCLWYTNGFKYTTQMFIRNVIINVLLIPLGEKNSTKTQLYLQWKECVKELCKKKKSSKFLEFVSWTLEKLH